MDTYIAWLDQQEEAWFAANPQETSHAAYQVWMKKAIAEGRDHSLKAYLTWIG